MIPIISRNRNFTQILFTFEIPTFDRQDIEPDVQESITAFIQTALKTYYAGYSNHRVLSESVRTLSPSATAGRILQELCKPGRPVAEINRVYLTMTLVTPQNGGSQDPLPVEFLECTIHSHVLEENEAENRTEHKDFITHVFPIGFMLNMGTMAVQRTGEYRFSLNFDQRVVQKDIESSKKYLLELCENNLTVFFEEMQALFSRMSLAKFTIEPEAFREKLKAEIEEHYEFRLANPSSPSRQVVGLEVTFSNIKAGETMVSYKLRRTLEETKTPLNEVTDEEYESTPVSSGVVIMEQATDRSTLPQPEPTPAAPENITVGLASQHPTVIEVEDDPDVLEQDLTPSE